MPPDDLEMADLCSALRHSYWPCDSFDRMTSPAWVADLTSWKRLGRKNPECDPPLDAA